jgi:uncharacterized membrane protein YidH (DUF202 family)
MNAETKAQTENGAFLEQLLLVARDGKNVLGTLVQCANRETRLEEESAKLIGQQNFILSDMLTKLGQQGELARERNELNTKLVDSSEQRTAMADTRTKLMQQQTQLSTKNMEMAQERTKLANTRTDMANRRTGLAEHRTQLSEKRTTLADSRTDLAQRRTQLADRRTEFATTRTQLAHERTGFSTERTELAKGRNHLAVIRTHLSSHRTIMAKERTLLAFIRTGLALIALGTGFIRYFGFGWWSVLDTVIIGTGILMLGYAVKVYWRARKEEKAVLLILKDKIPGIDDFAPHQKS